MDKDYNVGSVNTKKIKIKVIAATAATCYTQAYQIINDKRKIRAESSEMSNGNIPEEDIETAGVLKNTVLIVQTIADFSACPPEIIQDVMTDFSSLRNNLSISLRLDGGSSGKKYFDYGENDCFIATPLNQVIITNQINLI